MGLIYGALILNITGVITANPDREYPTAGIVTTVNTETDTVAFTENSGAVFVFEGVEDWQKGDIVAAIMDDNGTPFRSDDKIVKVEYSGYIY